MGPTRVCLLPQPEMNYNLPRVTPGFFILAIPYAGLRIPQCGGGLPSVEPPIGLSGLSLAADQWHRDRLLAP
jgi:hypothetical protein